MDNPRAEKVAVVDEVRDHFRAADAAILTEYRGLTVKEISALRRQLSPAGGDYKVYKNTLVRFAARELEVEGLEELLVGPTAIAFIKGDAVMVAKALRDFARTNPKLVVKGGLLGDKFLDAKDTAALADVPPREVLLARFAGGLAAPMQTFAGLIQALPRNFAYGLKALIDIGGAPGAPASAPATDADAGAPAASDAPSELADAPQTLPVEQAAGSDDAAGAAEAVTDAGEAADATEAAPSAASPADGEAPAELADSPQTQPVDEATTPDPVPVTETAPAAEPESTETATEEQGA